MRVTFNKLTALRLLRIARKRAGKRGLSRARVDLADPDPSPRKRWSKRLLAGVLAELDPRAPKCFPLDICVSGNGSRLASQAASNTIYARIPLNSFLDLGDGVRVSCPELLFVELATVLPMPQHLLVGFELCGCFSRDPYDPIGGHATGVLPPVTSVARISRYLEAASPLAGTAQTRCVLALLSDNAWSPAEATVATMMALPLEENGYGFGRCVLNERVRMPERLAQAAKRESRVPDILVDGTRVGVNYDGESHLDLRSLVNAAIAFGGNPASRTLEMNLQEAEARIRAKVVDDNHRNRELLVNGYLVFPVFKEDLYGEGGLDSTMLQIYEALRVFGGRDLAVEREIVGQAAARRARRQLLTSLMPGRTCDDTGDVDEAIVRIKRR